jgi:hypothetical protein
MGIFYLKYRDTAPVLRTTLKNPDGTVRDLTGASGLKLHIKLNTGTVLTRDLSILGAPGNGEVTYAWQASDWTDGLIVSPVPPLKPTDVEHTMEYEAVTPSGRMTHPNNGYDVLRILPDYGQGS